MIYEENTMEILEYINDYKDTVNQLMHDILVDEFGFQNFSENILKSQNEEFCSGNNKLWLALDNSEVVGTTGLIEISEHHALLKKVYVKEAYRGKGIAQQLLNMCLQYAKDQGYDYIILETYERLTRARNFYSKNGFLEYYDGYQKNQGDEIRYRLDLKAS